MAVTSGGTCVWDEHELAVSNESPVQPERRLMDAAEVGRAEPRSVFRCALRRRPRQDCGSSCHRMSGHFGHFRSRGAWILAVEGRYPDMAGPNLRERRRRRRRNFCGLCTFSCRIRRTGKVSEKYRLPSTFYQARPPSGRLWGSDAPFCSKFSV